jgi:outer membrane protein assembly factor BamB
LTLMLAPLSPVPSFAQQAVQSETPSWSQWRGPLGTGVSPDGDPPIEWSETSNVLFKVDVPGESLASPVIWGDTIYLVTAIPLDQQAYAAAQQDAQKTFDAGEWPPDVAPVKQRFLVQARSRHDGSLIWERTARESVPHESHYLDSSWACGSPIVDGERLYVHFGSNGTYAYDLDGELLWQVDLGDMTTRRGFGEGSSPALHGNSLIINWDHEGDSFIVALDKRTGKELWRTERPGEVTSWSTPLVVEHESGTQIVVSATGFSRGYDFATGKELWRVSGMTVNSIPTPVHLDGTVFLASGYQGNMLQAVDLTLATKGGAKGDLAGTDAVLWQYERDTPYVASVLLYEDQLYFVKHFRNVFTSLDARTGEVHFTERLPTIRNVYASPVAAAGRIYIFGRGGEALVLKHGKTLEVLAQNTLDDGIDATPAIVGSVIYVRGRHSLYALATSDR